MAIKSKVNVADDTISVISGIAATQVPGVLAMGDGVTFNVLPFISRNNLKKGVEIVKDENTGELTIKLTIVLKDGENLKKVSANVQEKVKESVEQMLDLTVAKVIVRVAKVDDI